MSDSTARAAFERHCIDTLEFESAEIEHYRDPETYGSNHPLCELWSTWQASRTSTIKELSGEGARELVSKIRELIPWGSPPYEVLYEHKPVLSDDEATALIEAWGEEKTRVLRETAETWEWAAKAKDKQIAEFFDYITQLEEKTRALSAALVELHQILPWQADVTGLVGLEMQQWYRKHEQVLDKALAALKDSPPLSVEEQI